MGESVCKQNFSFCGKLYRPPGSASEEFQLFREQLDYIRTHHKGKKLHSVHILGDFNFKDTDWPDRLSKSRFDVKSVGGTNIDWHYEWSWLRTNGTLPHSRKEHIWLDSHHSIQDVRSPDKLSDRDIVSGTLKIFPSPSKETSEKGVSISEWEKTHLSLQRKNTSVATRILVQYRRVQENFALLTSFIQDSADKHIPSKTSRSVSSVPCITPEIRRKIRRRNKIHAKAKKTGSSKLRSKFETLRREIKADVRKRHDFVCE